LYADFLEADVFMQVIVTLGERDVHHLQLLWLKWLIHATWQTQEPPNTTPSQECFASSNIFPKGCRQPK